MKTGISNFLLQPKKWGCLFFRRKINMDSCWHYTCLKDLCEKCCTCGEELIISLSTIFTDYQIKIEKACDEAWEKNGERK